MGIKGNLEPVMDAFRRVKVHAKAILQCLEDCEFVTDEEVLDYITQMEIRAEWIKQALGKKEVQGQLDQDAGLNRLVQEAEDFFQEAMAVYTNNLDDVIDESGETMCCGVPTRNRKCPVCCEKY